MVLEARNYARRVPTAWRTKRASTNRLVRTSTTTPISLIPRGMSLLAVAALFAAQKHRDQTRASGLPYIVHPIEVFLVLIRAGVRDSSVLAVALLHDTLEQTQASFMKLKELFSYDPRTATLKMLASLLAFLVHDRITTGIDRTIFVFVRCVSVSWHFAAKWRLVGRRGDGISFGH